MEVMTDCKAFNKKTNTCTALNETFCAYEVCRFYKTVEQYELEERKCRRRLQQLRFYRKGKK